MGEVFRAADLELGGEVAVKILSSVNATDIIRLKAEFRALANIVHPNLVDLHELFVNDKTAFFTMEVVNGVELVEYLGGALGRAATPERIDKLRDAARQLALALHAVHAGGKLHRDVKPSNVMVTDAGRVVLLDFGLSEAFGSADEASPAGIAGTLQYMAPEQAWGKRLEPAADWYSVGVTLFEAITGVLPVDGNPAEILQRKQVYRSASLRADGFDIPPELDELLQRLLAVDPSARPTAPEIVRALGGELLADGELVGAGTQTGLPKLVGRSAELAQLAGALLDCADGTHRLVHLVGPSGIGKTSILHELATRQPHDCRILSARCHPQETVAFNAIDGLIDDLIQRLPQQTALASHQLAPDQRAALIRVFPALGPTVDQAGNPLPPVDTDQLRLRQLAFVGLSSLLLALAVEAPLLLWLDDVQWADADSGAILRSLVRTRGRRGITIVLAYRDTDRATSACLEVLEDSSEEEPVGYRRSVMELQPLSGADGWELVESITSTSNQVASRDHIKNVVDQAAGVPFLLCELARHLSSSGGKEEELGLDALLRRRMGALPAESQAVLEVLCVAGSPLSQAVALRAAGYSDANRTLLTGLERLLVLRTADVRSRTVEVYHHRIRDHILVGMPAPKRREYHRQIAFSLLSTRHPNLLASVDHFEAASDLDSLRRYVVPAAEGAARVLAFGRAAQLYRRAIQLETRDLAAYELRYRLGVALANMGHGKEAGDAFSEAADLLKREKQTEPRQVLMLRQRAAEQYIQVGHYEQGMAELTAVLDELAVPFPRDRGVALRKATLLRLASLARRMHQAGEPDEAPSELSLQRFDALWATGMRISMFDHTRSSYAVIRCALDAVALGDRSRLTRALSLEAANLATIPAALFQTRADQLLERARSLEQRGVTDYDRAFVRAAGGIVSAFRGQYKESLAALDWAIAHLRATVPGNHWECTLWEVWTYYALTNLGELRELSQRVTAALNEGQPRQDRFLIWCASIGHAAMAWLAQDRADRVTQQAEQTRDWLPKDYTSQHFEHFNSRLHCELYRERGLLAWEMCEREWPLLKRNHFLKLAYLRDQLIELRARAALAGAAELRATGRRETASGMSAAALLEVANSCATSIEKHGLHPCQAWVTYLRALVAIQQGQLDAAASGMQRAVLEFDTRGMQLYRETARAVAGQLRPVSSNSQVSQALDWFQSQGVVAPHSMVRMLAPGTAFTT